MNIIKKTNALSRRDFIKLGVANAAVTEFGLFSNAKANSAISLKASGCCLMHGGEKLIAQSRLSGSDRSEGFIHQSGDQRFDRSLGMLLADLSQKFKVRPGFGYYDDLGSPNALALPQSRLVNSEGTVLFGKDMLSRHKNTTHGDMFIMGICAHEFAHIVQFFSGFYDRLSNGQSTKKLVELHADFLSGYYIGLRKINYSRSELLSLGKAWEDLGDSSYTDPQHHGTPEQRLRAIEQGYKFVKERPEFGIAAASEVGLRYVQTL